MAATVQHCNTASTQSALQKPTTASPNPQLKRLVYSKYRELLGSYNDQANAYIDTLPSYMVHKDNGFQIELKNETPGTHAHAANTIHLLANDGDGGIEMYGSGQRMPGQSTYEAPACVQNAMNRDKKPFTYTPGGIDLSQIKSERMAKRLARNANIEGASGQSQQNRPTQAMSPSSPGSAAASMGAAAMGMPFQVLPPSPHPTAGKNLNGGSAPAPPPPPPSSSNFLNTGKPQMNGMNGGAPNSPNMPRKAPSGPPQRFEPPPLGFRPEIKIPPNPMAALRKVPPPVEKNTFWKDEYKKNRVNDEDTAPPRNNGYTDAVDSVNSFSSTNNNNNNNTPQTNTSNGTEYMRTNGETNYYNNSDTIDGFKKAMPTTTTNRMQPNQTTNNTTITQQQEEAIKTPPKPQTPPASADSEKPKSQSQSPREASQDTQSLTSINSSNRPTPPTSPHHQQQQQFANKSGKLQDRDTATPPAAASPKPVSPPYNTINQIQNENQQQQKQNSPKPEVRSVATSNQPAVNVFNRQTDSPRSVENATPPRATESPFKYAQQQQQQQRTPVAMSPLAAQQTTPSSASSGASISPNPPQAQTVPWRTQRGQTPQKQQPVAPVSANQSLPQPFYNNVQQQPQQQQQQQQIPRAPDFSTQSLPYQGPKPTNVGSLYIAPLAQPTEPQAQHIVRQHQLQQQQQQQPQRDSPMRTTAPQSNAPAGGGNLRWMSSQPKQNEQPAWARPEENGNVMPSSLNRLKSPPPPPAQPPSAFASQQQQQQQQQQQSMLYQQQQPQQQQPSMYHVPLTINQGNGFAAVAAPLNFGAHQHVAPTGLRLQINTQSIQNQNQNQTGGPRERIIPIQLEQTPTYTPSSQPSFNTTPAYGAGSVSPAPGYVMRTPNQFVDQGYNNFGAAQPQRVMSPPMQQQQQQQPQQQLNAPRMVQQQQQQTNAVSSSGTTRTHIIPIAMENSEGTRGPISKTPIVIQNDLRSPPVQSKSFRILQKITDTIDDGTNEDSASNQQRNDNYMEAEPQLQRPTFARQMSAQLARNSPTVEQMRRMKIGHEQGNSMPQTPSQFNQQPRPFYNSNHDYIPPSEQQVPEPKKYTGSAIPSRSFKILQAMTQPENAGEHDNTLDDNLPDDTIDETKSEHNNASCSSSSSIEPVSSPSMSSLSSESICSGPTPPPLLTNQVTCSPQQPLAYPQYPYPYGYPWYPPPHPGCPPPPTNGDNTNTTNWHYPYAMPPPPPPGAAATAQTVASTAANGDVQHPTANWPYPYPMPPPQRPASPINGENMPIHPPFAPYPYYYPYPYAMPPYHPQASASGEFAHYLPPPPPYHAYPYPVAPSSSQSSGSSRASSCLPDIIITPSTEDVPSKMIMQHQIKIEKERPTKRCKSMEIENVSTTIKAKQPSSNRSSVFDILTQHLENLEQNNLNSSLNSNKKSYMKNFDQKSPDDNTSPVQITMLMTGSEKDSDTESSDSDVTTKQYDTKKHNASGSGAVPLQSIRSVSNVQFYNDQNRENCDQEESDDDDDDDSSTADGESDIFDEEEGGTTISGDFDYDKHEEHPDSECEEFYGEDNLSVIYEEESDYEKSSELIKAYKKSDNLATIENQGVKKHNEKEEEEEEETENPVTVCLPLKFSFSKSSTTDTPIATVEVGKSLVDRDSRNSLSSSEKRNSFSVATLENTDDEGDSDSCDVSVTISLSNSSRSGSLDSKDGLRNLADKYPIEDMPLPDKTLAAIASSEEDVSFSLTLNNRNKFVGQTFKGDITNNISQVEEREESPENEPSSNLEKSKIKQSTEELDFFATLMATKMQAQKVKDQTASYWGKSIEQKEEEEKKEKKKEVSQEEKDTLMEKLTIPEPSKVPEAEKQSKETDDIETRKSFWSSFSTKSSTDIATKVKELPQNSIEKLDKIYSNDTRTYKPDMPDKKSNESLEIQTEKVKCESTNIWENSSDSKNESSISKDSEVKAPKSNEPSKTTLSQSESENKDDLETRKNFWSSISAKKSEEIKETPQNSESETKEADDSTDIDDIWANRDDDYMPPKKSSYNFAGSHNKTSEISSENTSDHNEQSPSVSENVNEEIEDIWATKEDDVSKSSCDKINSKDTKIDEKLDTSFNLTSKSSNQSKQNNSEKLESAKSSFWSTFAATNKQSLENSDAENITHEKADLKKSKISSMKQEMIQKESFSRPPVLRHRIEELTQRQTPLIHFEWQTTEEEEETLEESAEAEAEVIDEDIDFWSKMEESQDVPKEHSTAIATEEEISSFWENQNEEDEEEEEDQENNSNAYNPLHYPEEPREVDTDEEIDFWAEIESKRNPDDDEEDLTFHRAATFWATHDRKNSVDETPYKPVPTKPFHAKLPDEPPITHKNNMLAALEAHKGEEPVLVDPQFEEETQLAQEFDEMPHESETRDYMDHNSSNFDLASIHSAVTSSVWKPPQMEIPQISQVTEDVDFWSEIEEKQKSESVARETNTEKNNDRETKRNNYKKAMAFFSNSIDDHQVETASDLTPTPCVQTNTEMPALDLTPTLNVQSNLQNWNWEDSNGITVHQHKVETLKPDEAAKARKPPKKDRKPKVNTKSNTPSKEDITTSNFNDFPEVYIEPTLDHRRLSNTGLPDLPEVYVEPTLDLRRLSNNGLPDFPEVYVEPTHDLRRLSNNGLPDLQVNKFNEESKVSVRDRISSFESGKVDATDSRRNSLQNQSLSVESSTQSSLSRNSSTHRSESEIDEDDSGVTDMNKLSESGTESDSFPELKKMSSYQRAATHSRLFKLLQDDTEGLDEAREEDLRPSRKKVVHNVSITRKQNPSLAAEAETLSQRRERLSLPLCKNASIDADNPSTPNSPASPTMGHTSGNHQSVVSDKLVSELVQSLLLKSDSTHLRKLPMEKLQAAAKRVLEEELDSLENTSVDSTPSMTPNEVKKDKSYADYYSTWSDANGSAEVVPSKSFRALQDTRRSPWTARCPRVLSSKTINRDLTRVSESPEISMRNSKSQSRENSVSRWKKA